MPLCDISFIHGTWYLDEAYAIDDAGTRLYDVYGDKPDGVITYSPDGRMVALITHAGRARMQGDRQAAPAEERAEAYSSCISYGGTYTVEADRVIHHVDISTYQNWVGTDLVRLYERGPDSLTLRTIPQMQNGRMTVMLLAWKRQPPRPRARPKAG